jgi:hypothetical protein
MQLRSLLDHRRRCWGLTSPNINTSKTNTRQYIPLSSIDVNVVLHCNAVPIASPPTEPIERLSAHIRQPMVDTNATFETLTAQIDRCQRRVALQRIRNRFGAIGTNIGI